MSINEKGEMDPEALIVFFTPLVSMSTWPVMPVQIWNLSVRSRQVS